MIVLVILGVVAAITVPALVRNQMDAQNRTRLRKAMTVYDMAINKMVVENNFKSNTALTDWGNGNNCVNTREYFKIVQDGKNGCIFSTASGLWWNISDITKPIVGFNEDDIEVANSTTSFQLFGHFGDNGELRIDDLAYEQISDFLSNDEKQLLADLYNFANNVKEEDTRTDFQKNCVSINETQCKIGDTIYTKKTIAQTTIDRDYVGQELCIWTKEDGRTCSYISTSEAGDLYFTNPVSSDDYMSYQDTDSSICQGCKNGGYPDYYNAAKRYCEDKGGRLPTIAELQAGGYNNGYFWASEEDLSGDAAYGSNNGLIASFIKGDPYDEFYGSYTSNFNVVCVGK